MGEKWENGKNRMGNVELGTWYSLAIPNLSFRHSRRLPETSRGSEIVFFSAEKVREIGKKW